MNISVSENVRFLCASISHYYFQINALTVDPRTAKSAITWPDTAANHAAINAKPICFHSGFSMVKLEPPVDIMAGQLIPRNGLAS